MQNQPTEPIPVEEMLDGDGHPHWERITLDVLCSRCGYNVRGLAQPRCPECGLQFEWRDLLSGLGRTTNWLFEHNWLEKPLRSWLVTVVQEMRGRAFWRQLSIHHHITPGPLIVMMLAAPLMTVVVSLALAWVGATTFPIAVRAVSWDNSRNTDRLLAAASMFVDGCEGFVSVATSVSGEFLVLPASVAFIYGMLAVVLCCYRQTLSRHKLRTIQVLRVVAHAAFPAGVAVGFTFVTAGLVGAIVESFAPRSAAFVTLSLGLVLPIVVGTVVGRGLRIYLGIRTGILTAGLSTLLVQLIYPFVVGIVVFIMYW